MVNSGTSTMQELDRSPNSSITLDSATPPSSTPEQGATMLLDASLEMDTRTTLLSPLRTIPWETKILRSASTLFDKPIITPEESLKVLDGLPVLSKEPLEAPTNQSEDTLPATPPLTPDADSDDDSSIQSLRQAIMISLTALKANSLNLKSILKTPFNTPANSQTTASLDCTASTSTQSNSTNRIITDSLSQSMGNSQTPQSQKKTVRWELSEEQEQKERLKPQLPLSPKLHKGNRLIFTDESEDELMSVCSDDGPTPPLSPSYSSHELKCSPTSSLEIVESLDWAILECEANTRQNESIYDVSSVEHTSNSSNSSVESPSKQLGATANAGIGALVPEVLNTISSSTDPISAPPLKRSKSQQFSTSTIRNERLGTTSDPLTRVPVVQLSALPEYRTASDATSSLRNLSSRKRHRSDDMSHGSAGDVDAVLAGIPQCKQARID